MQRIKYAVLFVFFASAIYAQQEPVKIEGKAQGTTYHITYFDKQNRNFQHEIEKILEDFDKSVSTYLPTSIISRINAGEKDVIVDKYFIACFKKAKEVFGKFSSPWIVKSFSADPDMGVHIAKTFPELVDALQDGIAHGKSILVEELIEGKSISTHSVAGFRGKNIYTFPLGNFSQEEKEKIISLAEALFEHLGTSHYLKSNFISNPNRGIFLQDVSFSPDLRDDSEFCQACESVGAKVHHVLEHMIDKALLASR